MGLSKPFPLLALILLVRFVPSFASIRCGKCEKGSSLACPNSLQMQYGIELMEYNEDPEGGLRFRCDYASKELNLTWLEGCSFPSVLFVRIQLCPLFSEPVGDVLRKIGVNSEGLQYLWWDTAHLIEEGLQPWHLDGLPNLSSLVIQSNYFQSLPKEFLKSTPLLERLIIKENNFTLLPDDFFSYTPNISTLELGSNNLSRLPDNLLSNLHNLSIVTISGNKLDFLPLNIFQNNSRLKMISLTSNNLESIPEFTFSHLKSLFSLDLRINKIQSLPKNIFSGCSNLSTLLMTHNSLAEFPSDVFRGTALKFANFGYNKITNLSTAFSNLETLQNLTLHKNLLTTIPRNTFSGSENIVRLDLQANEIQIIEDGAFAQLRKLRIILLNYNVITKVPEYLFADCVSLLQVYMQHNHISSLPLNTFAQNSPIFKLDLSYNTLTFSNPYVTPLNKLTFLQDLNLSHNNISSIHNDFLFVHLQLKNLDMSHNSLTSLQDADIGFLSNVSLNLQHNNISSLRISENLQNFNKDKILTLSLAGNPLTCDCTMFQFLNTAQMIPPFPMNMNLNLLITDAESTTCAAPESFKFIALPDVNLADLFCDYPCSPDCDCYIKPKDRKLDMDCSDRMLQESPSLLQNFDNVYQLYNIFLDLSGNEYEDVKFLSNFNSTRLVHVNLANNSLSQINETFLPSTLQMLDLRDNNFTTISENVLTYLNKSSLKLNLGSNPWNCDCDLLKFHEFLRDNFEKVLDRGQVLCADTRAPIEEMSPEQLCSLLGRPAAVGTIAAMVFILLLVAVLVTAAWYRHKELIKVWLYSHNMCLWAITETEIDADKKYDAFVSYSYKDESFVNNYLVPGLESGPPPYKVCLHYRDWVPGEYIQDQILNSVKASRRTLVVLSKNFLESVWGQLEFKAAHSQALKDKTNRIIVIVYGEVPDEKELDGALKLYLSTNTYLQWGDQRFWDRLRYAMPHARYAKHVKKTQVDKLEMVKPAPPSEVKTVEA